MNAATKETWPEINRKREELIVQKINGTISDSDNALLKELNAVIEEYLCRTTPLLLESLKELERRLG